MTSIEYGDVQISIPAYAIDGDDIVTAIRALAEAEPERVYGYLFCTDGGCSNVDSSDQPGRGCIVGEALIGLGVSRDILAAMEECPPHKYPAKVTSMRSRSILAWLGIAVPIGVDDWISRAQSVQDSGNPWADAIEAADRQCPIVPDTE